MGEWIRDTAARVIGCLADFMLASDPPAMLAAAAERVAPYRVLATGAPVLCDALTAAHIARLFAIGHVVLPLRRCPALPTAR